MGMKEVLKEPLKAMLEAPSFIARLESAGELITADLIVCVGLGCTWREPRQASPRRRQRVLPITAPCAHSQLMNATHFPENAKTSSEPAPRSVQRAALYLQRTLEKLEFPPPVFYLALR